MAQLQPKTLLIHRYAGISMQKLCIGTILWRWLDSIRTNHKFYIPNYIPDPAGHTHLSPQQWESHTGDPQNEGGAGCKMRETEVVLFWGKVELY